MRRDRRIWLAVEIAAACCTLAHCGGGTTGRGQAATGSTPPEVVRQLEAPETPDRVIYSPPVSLAKPTDTTSHRRKPGT